MAMGIRGNCVCGFPSSSAGSTSEAQVTLVGRSSEADSSLSFPCTYLSETLGDVVHLPPAVTYLINTWLPI